MTRRGFFALLAAAVVGRKRSLFDASDFVWPSASGSLTDVSTFVFHPDAFALTMEPLDVERYIEGLSCKPITIQLSGEWL